MIPNILRYVVDINRVLNYLVDTDVTLLLTRYEPIRWSCHVIPNIER